MNKKKFQSILFASAAAFIVTGCGADSVASPGEGNIVVLPTPAPTPAPTPTPRHAIVRYQVLFKAIWFCPSAPIQPTLFIHCPAALKSALTAEQRVS